MTSLRKVTRKGGNSRIAVALGGAVLVLGCSTAPDPTPRASSPDAGATDIESNDTPSDGTTDDLNPNEPEATEAGDREKGRRVVGYLPTYRFAESPPLHLDTLTHLILAFAVPNQEGEADFLNVQHADVQRIVDEAHTSHVKVLAALGGGAGGAATSTRLRGGVASYVASVIDLIETYGLDGIDVDIEGESIEPETYEPLMLALSKRLRDFPERKLLTAAVAGYKRENYRALGTVDFLNVMSYDQCGGWSERACEHSTPTQAQIDLDYWSTFAQADESGSPRRIGAENVVLGVPFYGRCWGERCPERPLKDDGTYATTSDLPYSKIAAYCADGLFSDCSPSADVLTDGDELLGYYVSLNSPRTIKNKSEQAKNHGGIMIWELGQDTNDATLFTEIEQAFPKRAARHSRSR